MRLQTGPELKLQFRFDHLASQTVFQNGLYPQRPIFFGPRIEYLGDSGNEQEVPFIDQVSTMTKNFRDMLETFENEFPTRDYTIEITCPEFTSVCPKTGQPDFGVLLFEYIPDKVCVELKSLKMYLQQFRSEGIFYEKVTNEIFDDFVAVAKPREARLTAKFTPRGGISSVIKVELERS